MPDESHVFTRAWARSLPTAVRAEGVWIVDADGRRYLDASGGAVVSSIGHGNPGVVSAVAAQLEAVDYVHATAFTTKALEAYAEDLAEVLPVDDARVFPVSGGSEAAETAIKLARTFHIARGEPERSVIIGRWGSYHGNTLGALDVSGRASLRQDYLPWLGRFEHVPAVNEYRCPNPRHPVSCGAWHAGRLTEAIEDVGPERVAAFMAEPIGGATSGATVPPDDYWPEVAAVCRRMGVLVIADEVMTGFGRTGAWFGIDHWRVRPDIVICGKGAASGYWPLGLCVASGTVWESAAPVFRHGFTYSHHPVGAAAGRAVLDVIRADRLVERAASADLLERVAGAVGHHRHVGDVRGRGLLVGVEFVADRETKTPFSRDSAISEHVMAAAVDHGLLTYPIVGCADGTAGDGVLLGPPLVIAPEEMGEVTDRLAASIAEVLG